MAFKAISRIDSRSSSGGSPPTPKVGGPIAGDPYQWRKYWTGSKIGDLLVGLKASLLSESYGQPSPSRSAASFKLPTGDSAMGGQPRENRTAISILVVSKDLWRDSQKFLATRAASFAG